MNRAWIARNEGRLEIFYGKEPEKDEVTGLYYGKSTDLIYDEFMPLTEEILKLKEDDAPIEICIAPVERINAAKDDEFFTLLATKMRLLWPSGDKDNRYAWRDSVPNLKKRLETLWRVRNLRDYTIDDCLKICRKYLAKYETDTKYMQVLKYFILKQKEIVENDGRIRYLNSSRFADMLEGKLAEDAAEEFDMLMNGHNNDNLI